METARANCCDQIQLHSFYWRDDIPQISSSLHKTPAMGSVGWVLSHNHKLNHFGATNFTTVSPSSSDSLLSNLRHSLIATKPPPIASVSRTNGLLLGHLTIESLMHLRSILGQDMQNSATHLLWQTWTGRTMPTTLPGTSEGSGFLGCLHVYARVCCERSLYWS